MELLTRYALAARARIDKPILESHFFSLPFSDKYIIVVSGSGMEAKNYAYWNLTLEFLKPILNEAGYKLIQTGGEKDEQLIVDLDIRGKTTIYQYSWLIQNASLVLCGDTSAIHIAGAHDTPFVSLFALSRPSISGSYFGNKSKQIYITPSENWNPSFFPGENPKQIDNIKPEQVVEAVCKLLSLNFQTFKTLHIGQKYLHSIIDIVPNCVAPAQFLQGALLNIRFDKGGEETIVYEQLKHRQCTIITKKELNKDAIRALKGNIVKVFYVIGKDYSLDFVKFLKIEGIQFETISVLNEEGTNLLKLDFADYSILYPESMFFSVFNDQIEFDNISKVRCKTRRRILSNGKFYLNYKSHDENSPIQDFNQSDTPVVDDVNFWCESDYYYLYELLE